MKINRHIMRMRGLAHPGTRQSSSTEDARGRSRSGGTLTTLDRLSHFQKRLDAALPDALVGRILLSLDRGGQPLLIARDGAAATAARFAAAEIGRIIGDWIWTSSRRNNSSAPKPSREASDHLLKGHLRIRVIPGNTLAQRKTKGPRAISQESADALSTLAQTCPDPELSRVLSRLAAHARNPTSD